MIGEIENGMLARIKAAMDAGTLGYTLKKLETWAGDIDDLHQEIKNFPAVWVFFSGLRPVKQTNQSVKCQARFSLMVAATNQRNEKAARQGAEGKPGSYQIGLDAVHLLSNQTFGLQIDPMKLSDWKPLVQERAGNSLASIHGLEFITAFEIDNLSASDLDDFETFHANWDVPAFGNVTPPIPADDKADATDNVTLETE